MHTHRAIYIAVFLAIICCLCASSNGASKKAEKVFDRIPGVYDPIVKALGKRVQENGKEKTVYIGEYFDHSNKSKRAKATIQLPRLARLEGFKNAVISFDGKNKKNANDRGDNSLLETFLMDTAEGLLASVQESASIRLLGLRFYPDLIAYKNGYNGPLYDIYDAIGPDAIWAGQPFQSRQFYFDSKSKLLSRVQHYDRTASPPVKVETHFPVWGTIDNSAYPACIERYENGSLIFSFIATSIESGPADDEKEYR
jgi:hypothetical protein